LTKFDPCSYDLGTATREPGTAITTMERVESTNRAFRARFGARLERARRRQKLTQGQLAARLGRTRNSVARWESGDSVPEAELLVALSRELEVSIDFLLTGAAAGAAHDPRLLARIETIERLPAERFEALLRRLDEEPRPAVARRAPAPTRR